MTATATVEMSKETPKDASASVIAQQAAMLNALPFSDTADFDDAARGFMGTLDHARIANAQGRVVWSLEPYGFLSDGKAPLTVNPSLWRQSRLNMQHGLFEVVPGVYQVRGLDIANMTLIEGDTGVIVVDTLTSIEGARAAMELYFKHRGLRPVAAVIFTHTHTDHWGGARGVLAEEVLASGRVPIIAPNLFMEHAVSENIIAGPAMLRRAQYQFGPFLTKGPRGQVDCGLGKSMAAGSVALLRPTDLIMETGDRRVVDGLEFEFQMAPNSEAPAEMHFYVPRFKLLNLAENCTHNFHNLLPFRGADVRDALAWSKYLGEALAMWGGKAEAMCGQHHWPVWGKARIDTMIRQQRDLYKFAHDQTIRLMNHGLTATEIAETIKLPASLEGAWHTRGYYGHIRHNVKAIYQKYLGWYDANPVHLDPLPPVESGKKYANTWAAQPRSSIARGRILPRANSASWRRRSAIWCSPSPTMRPPARCSPTPSSSSAMPRRARPGATPICSARRNCARACRRRRRARRCRARRWPRCAPGSCGTCSAFASTVPGPRASTSC
jgi:alkyl sulfatase BDS1-like metallo-beta-lactamase superfamily hydrolase